MENFYDGTAHSQSKHVRQSNIIKVKGKGATVSIKRKRDEFVDENDDDGHGISSTQGGEQGSSRAPKKMKHAFGFFVKAKRAEAEASIGDPMVGNFL